MSLLIREAMARLTAPGEWERTPLWQDWLPPWRRQKSMWHRVMYFDSAGYPPIPDHADEFDYASAADFLTM